jgi:hypothetical protein
MNTSHDDLLTPIEGLGSRPLADLRSWRDQCVAYETGLSFQRRMVQGPLDIVQREAQLRLGAGTRPDLAALVAELPDLLADAPRSVSTGPGRPLPPLEPTTVDPEFEAALASLLGGAGVGGLDRLDDDELARLGHDLAALERRISDRRHAFHERIDELQSEIVRRYQTGEASVDSLLSEPPSA